MDEITSNSNRKVFPRWRTFETTLKTGELGTIGKPRSLLPSDGDFLRAKLDAWHRNRTAHFASDLVGSGLVLGRSAEVIDAAEFLLRSDSSSSIWAREVANSVLSDGGLNESEFVVPSHLSFEQRYSQVAKYRSWLRQEPKDPIAWTDLALLYVILGQVEQAKRCITIALNLSQDNRFITRSASRLWVHVGDLDRAHHTLEQAAVHSRDPWLLSAEIAICDALGRRSRYLKQARQMILNDSFNPFHLTELTAAVATLELASGRGRKSRQLFARSLRQPNENSIAQAVWATRHDKQISVADNLFEANRAFEASCRRSFEKGHWRDTLIQCERWQYDEPFSSDPRILGSFVAGVALEDFERAKGFLRDLDIARTPSFTLLNNLAFAQINLGELNSAEVVLRSAKRCIDNVRDRAVWFATAGLLEYRRGNLEQGRNLYRDSRDLAKGISDNGVILALSSVFSALEELRSSGSVTCGVVENTERLLATGSSPVNKVLLERLNQRHRKALGNVQ